MPEKNKNKNIFTITSIVYSHGSYDYICSTGFVLNFNFNHIFTLSGRLSLSICLSLFRKLGSPSSVLATLHSGFFCSRIQTAAITVITRNGGLVYTRISEMAALSRVSRASVAMNRVGMTEDRSRWHSCNKNPKMFFLFFKQILNTCTNSSLELKKNYSKFAAKHTLYMQRKHDVSYNGVTGYGLLR